MDVLNGIIYIFICKRRYAIKLHRFEGFCFALFYKRLEKGIFAFPLHDNRSGTLVISDWKEH